MLKQYLLFCVWTAFLVLLGCEGNAQKTNDAKSKQLLDFPSKYRNVQLEQPPTINKKWHQLYTVADREGVEYEVRYYTHIKNQLRSKGFFKNGEKDGEWEYRYDNGKLMSKQFYENGEPEGQWQDWHENGERKATYTYKAGYQDGDWKVWYENGHKRELVQYADGLRNGQYVIWHENGQKRKEGTYVYGDQEGKWQEWNSTGKRIGLTYYKNGQEVTPPKPVAKQENTQTKQPKKSSRGELKIIDNR